MTEHMTAADYNAMKDVPKRNKYSAERTTIDGITFDSKSEGKRYAVLRNLERAGLVSGLELQVKYPLFVNGHGCGSYIADFTYVDEHGAFVVEDVKGMATPVYKIKKKLMKAIHGIDILETGGAAKAPHKGKIA